VFLSLISVLSMYRCVYSVSKLILFKYSKNMSFRKCSEAGQTPKKWIKPTARKISWVFQMNKAIFCHSDKCLSYYFRDIAKCFVQIRLHFGQLGRLLSVDNFFFLFFVLAHWAPSG
jgi:hypothetical protein